MKIAINIVGVSGDGTLVCSHPTTGASSFKERDWNIQKEVIMSQIVNCWEGHEISIYITTYNHSDIDNMMEFYKPKKSKILDYVGSNMLLTYIESLKQLLDEDVDFIISVRPDLFLFKKLSEYPIQFDKFNIFHKQASLWEHETEYADYDTARKLWERHIFPTYHLVNDGLFLCPKSMLPQFIDAVENLYKDKHFPGRIWCTLHNLWIHLRKFLSPEEIHYLIPGEHRFVNAPIQQAMKNFDNLEPSEKEYYLCRIADDNLEPYNKGEDWKQFVTFMKHKLAI